MKNTLVLNVCNEKKDNHGMNADRDFAYAQSLQVMPDVNRQRKTKYEYLSCHIGITELLENIIRKPA